MTPRHPAGELSPELTRLLGRAAWIIVIGAALALLAVPASAVGDRASFLVTTPQKIFLLVLPVVAVVAIVVGAARVSPIGRVKLATALVSTLGTLYVADVVVDRVVLEARWRRGAAAPAGVPFDRRSADQVADGMQAQGVPAVPAITPQHFQRPLRGTVPFSAGPVTVPLAGIANRPTVHCNESGEWVVYDSDQFGFSNPPAAWASRPEIAILGDSFAHGECVPPNQNVAGLLRASGREVLNLGISGSGPLSQLGRLEEYARGVQPATVLWFFYEGNDAQELDDEARVAVLEGYLTGATQSLTSHQPEIDRALLAFAESSLGSNAPSPTPISRVWRVLTLRAVRSALALHAPEEGPRAPDRRLHERVLTKARDDVASWGGRMYFVYLPAWDRYRHPERITSFKEDVLASVEGLGIPTIDMVEAFEAVPDPLDLFPFRSRGHYTESGYRLVTDAILAELAPSDPQPPPAS